MEFGRTYAQIVGLNCNFKEVERRNGTTQWSRAEFISVLLKMTGLRTGRFLRKRSSVCSPRFRQAALQHIKWSLDPIRWTLFGWEDNDEDLMFAQDASVAGQFVQQWKLRMRAQGAALREVADSKLRRLLAYNKSGNCADIHVGDSALFYNAQNRKSSPPW